MNISLSKKKFSFLFIIIISLPSLAQINLGGLPYSITIQKNSISARLAVPESSLRVLNPIDNLAEIERAEIIKGNCENCRNNYFGTAIEVGFDLKTDGTKTTLDNGYLYKLEIESKDAFGMQFHFSKYMLPETASLYIYNAEESMILGAFTHINNHQDEKFATIVVPGEKIMLEYFESFDAEFEGEIVLKRVVHAFVDVYDGAYRSNTSTEQANSSSCLIDVNCDDGNNYQELKKAVCRIAYLDSDSNLAGHCTGFLVNHSDPFKPAYVLTAGHCFRSDFNDPIVNTERYSDWVFEFDYESSSCDAFTKTTLNSHNGAILLTGAHPDVDNGDYALLDLQLDNIEDWLDVSKLGWTKETSGFGGVTGIHHPSGLPKKISTASSSGLVWDGLAWEVTWANGHTEGGSSGSPLLAAPNNYTIGLLSGGTSACDNGEKDYYASISSSWNTKNSKFSYGLGHYLDYSNEGLSSYDHFIPEDDDDSSSGGGTGTGSSSCGVLTYREAFSIGEADILISDFDTEACFGTQVACAQSGNADCNQFYYSHGSKVYTHHPQYGIHHLEDDAIKYGCVSPSNDQIARGGFLKMKAKPYGDASSDRYYSGVFTQQSFDKNKKIVFSFDIKMYPNSKVRFIVTNNITTSACNQLIDDQVSIDWSQSQLLASVTTEYLESTQSSIQYPYGFYKYATEITPNKDYQYLWILFETQFQPLSPYQFHQGSASIDNLQIHYPENFNTNNLEYNLAFGEMEKNAMIIHSSQMTDGVLASESITAGKSSLLGQTFYPIVQNGQNVTFKSKSIVLKDGFEVKAGGTFHAKSSSMISSNPNAPSGPLIDADYYANSAARIKEESAPLQSYSANYSDSKNIYSFVDLEYKHMSDGNEDKLIVYPNPAVNQINITPIDQESHIQILNLSGQVLKKYFLAEKTESLDISDLNNGLYILRMITANKQEHVEKFLIEK